MTAARTVDIVWYYDGHTWRQSPRFAVPRDAATLDQFLRNPKAGSR